MRLRLGTGPEGRALFPTDAERAKREGERAKKAAAHAEATEQAKAQAEQEIAHLRAQLEAVRRGR